MPPLVPPTPTYELESVVSCYQTHLFKVTTGLKKSSSILTKLSDTLFHAPSHVVISFFLTLSPRNHFFVSSTAHQKLLFKLILKLKLLIKWITPLEGHEKPCLRKVASCEHFLLGGHSCVRKGLKTANAVCSQRQKLV